MAEILGGFVIDAFSHPTTKAVVIRVCKPPQNFRHFHALEMCVRRNRSSIYENINFMRRVILIRLLIVYGKLCEHKK